MNAQIIKEFSHAVRHHGRTTIGMKRELVGINTFPRAALANELASDHLGFTSCHRPTYNLATEDVDDCVEMVENTSRRTRESGDIPGPA